MTSTNLRNDFQAICRDALQDYFKSLGTAVEFESTEGDGSYLSAYLRAPVDHRGKEVELFVYEDQVGFNFAGQWHSYEKCAYPTIDVLLDETKASLARCFQADRDTYAREQELADHLGRLRLFGVLVGMFTAALIASLKLLPQGLARTWISGIIAAAAVVALAWSLRALVRVVSLWKEKGSTKVPGR